MTDVEELQSRISELEKDLADARDNLMFRRSLCKHVWEIKYYPILLNSTNWALSEIEGCKAKRRPEDRWRRTCSICGSIEETTEFIAICKKEPVFDGGSTP